LDTGSRQNGDMRGDKLPAFAAVVYGGLGADGELAFNPGVGVDEELQVVEILVASEREGKSRIVDGGNLPETEEGSENCSGARVPPVWGQTTKRSRNTQKECGDRNGSAKRMMEYTSNIMSFDWVGRDGHEGCPKGREFSATGTQEKKRDRGCFGGLVDRYRYANCSLGSLVGDSSGFG